jgi:hypothetical protein
MVFSIELAEQVASQLEKFTTSFAHQVSGQYANLEFWLHEVVHAIAVIDGYPARFAAMAVGQREWVTKHDTIVGSYCACCRGACEFDPGLSPPAMPIRVNPRQMDAAKRRVKDAAYHFLVRCHHIGLLDKLGLIAACERVGTSVDYADVKEERSTSG